MWAARYTLIASLAFILIFVTILSPDTAFGCIGIRGAVLNTFSTNPINLDGNIGSQEWAGSDGLSFISIEQGEYISFQTKYVPVENMFYISFEMPDKSVDSFDAISLAIDFGHEGRNNDRGDWTFSVTRDNEVSTYEGDGQQVVEKEFTTNFSTAVKEGLSGWSAEFAIKVPSDIANPIDDTRWGYQIAYKDWKTGEVMKHPPVYDTTRILGGVFDTGDMSDMVFSSGSQVEGLLKKPLYLVSVSDVVTPDKLKMINDNLQSSCPSCEKVVLTSKLNNPNVLAGLGDVHSAVGKFNDAHILYDTALKMQSDNVFALTGKGAAFSVQFKTDQAHIFFDKALAFEPKNAYPLAGKGSAFSDEGKFREAHDIFDSALNTHPNNPILLTAKGTAYASVGKYDLAHSFFDKALQVDPGNVKALIGKASTFSLQGEFDKASNYYEQTLNVDPGSPIALAGKGSSLRAQGNNLMEVKALYAQAVSGTIGYCGKPICPADAGMEPGKSILDGNDGTSVQVGNIFDILRLATPEELNTLPRERIALISPDVMLKLPSDVRKNLTPLLIDKMLLETKRSITPSIIKDFSPKTVASFSKDTVIALPEKTRLMLHPNVGKFSFFDIRAGSTILQQAAPGMEIGLLKAFVPPNVQLAQGIAPNEVACNDGLELLQKTSNGKPICVKPSTAESLIARGWAQQFS